MPIPVQRMLAEILEFESTERRSALEAVRARRAPSERPYARDHIRLGRSSRYISRENSDTCNRSDISKYKLISTMKNMVVLDIK